jgi:hypothetical protein
LHKKSAIQNSSDTWTERFKSIAGKKQQIKRNDSYISWKKAGYHVHYIWSMTTESGDSGCSFLSAISKFAREVSLISDLDFQQI